MGLLKTGLKAAVAVKTADVIHERVLAPQAQAAAHGHAQPAVAHPGPSAAVPAASSSASLTSEKLAQPQQLGELRASGV